MHSRLVSRRDAESAEMKNVYFPRSTFSLLAKRLCVLCASA
jgi:hypothetical protein